MLILWCDARVAAARMQDLIDEYNAKQITESYLIERYDQLKDMMSRPEYSHPNELPKIISDDPQQRYEDMKVINGNVLGNVWKGHLKDVESYIKYRLDSDPNLDRGDLSNEEWRESWRNAIKFEAMELRGKADLPLGVLNPEDIENTIDQDDMLQEADPEELKEREKKLKEIAESRHHKEFYDDIVSGLGKTDNERRMEVSGQEKEAQLLSMPQAIYENITELGKIDKELYMAVARPVALQLVEIRGGKIPGNMKLEQFTEKLARDKSFRAVLKPLFDEIHNEKTANDKAEKLESAEHLIGMVKDGTILHAFGLETRTAKMGKAGEGVKHAKTLAQVKEEENRLKAAEEARKQKAAGNGPQKNAAGNGQKQADKGKKQPERV
ncbi:MAG: hypothetical protein J6Y89_11635 [Lachnospiraceae bacterium]|nr:hypothetical protein [Lachnospiraceae bacterium]